MAFIEYMYYVFRVYFRDTGISAIKLIRSYLESGGVVVTASKTASSDIIHIRMDGSTTFRRTHCPRSPTRYTAGEDKAVEA